jgi:hypothetical protein
VAAYPDTFAIDRPAFPVLGAGPAGFVLDDLAFPASAFVAPPRAELVSVVSGRESLAAVVAGRESLAGVVSDQTALVSV